MSSLPEEFDALRIPYDDISAATNNFDTGNLIPQLFNCNTVYRGELLRSGKKMAVIIEKMISYETEDELLKLVSIISRFKHNNIATFVGFSYGYGGSYIVTEGEVNASLAQILNIVPVPSSSSNSFEDINKNLTCSQRLKICLGVAHALSHIHSCGAIHSDFSSTRILLDKNFEATVVGFALITENLSNLSFSRYTDPEFKRTCNMTVKSDVYSFGVVLMDVFCQEYAISLQSGDTTISEIDNTHFDDNIRQQMHSLRSLKMLSQTLNKCLNDKREQRPEIDEIVKVLDYVLIIQGRHENLESIKIIGLDDIKSATENFDEKYLIGQGSYGQVYKAHLNIYDDDLFPGKEGKNPNEMYIKHITVAIKRIINNKGGHGEQGFFLEIEILRICKHPNIVPLLGYCNEHYELILVYELAPNGSLHDYLESVKNKTYLNWVQRVKICLDIAHGFTKSNTVNNITLGDELEATVNVNIIISDKKSSISIAEIGLCKISDFELSRFTKSNTVNNITLGDELEATVNIIISDKKSSIRIAEIGLSKVFSVNKLGKSMKKLLNLSTSTVISTTIAGTVMYLDPEYAKTD
ncbi:receptor-like protein kinase FERONIA [Rutidosis leptorrhynchoides]|uniref:receptor-like protein kinase FERONIA n=1 Tax=Rutidosis leptorrhynchoides TaxID=125765 RepID=UPI003A98D62C